MMPEIGREYRLPDGRIVQCVGRNSLTMAVSVCLVDNPTEPWWMNPDELAEIDGEHV